MRVLDLIMNFGIAVYEQTGATPTRIHLPLVAHDQLKNECAAQIAQKPHVVPGTVSCIQLETGNGIIEVLTSTPEQVSSDPTNTEKKE